MVKAHFRNIRKKIIDRIASAKKEIRIATRSFTNKELLEVIKECSDRGIKVQLIMVDYTHNSKLDWSRLNGQNTSLLISKVENTYSLTDNFIIFDRARAFIGSYDLSDQSEHGSFASMIETSEETILKQYLSRFRMLEESSNAFDPDLFKTEDKIFQKREQKIVALENQLEEEVYRIISLINVNNLPIETEEIIQAVDAYGPTGAIRRMVLRTDMIVSGFDAFIENGFVNKTFESLVVQEKFQTLFSKEVIEKARERVS